MKILYYFILIFIWRFYVGNILSVEEGSHQTSLIGTGK